MNLNFSENNYEEAISLALKKGDILLRGSEYFCNTNSISDFDSEIEYSNQRKREVSFMADFATIQRCRWGYLLTELGKA